MDLKELGELIHKIQLDPSVLEDDEVITNLLAGLTTSGIILLGKMHREYGTTESNTIMSVLAYSYAMLTAEMGMREKDKFLVLENMIKLYRHAQPSVRKMTLDFVNKEVDDAIKEREASESDESSRLW